MIIVVRWVDAWFLGLLVRQIAALLVITGFRNADVGEVAVDPLGLMRM